MKSLTDLAGNLDAPTAQVLTALRIVATRADVGELVEWTEKELEGYQDGDELPSHRIWKLAIKANLYNPLQAAMKDVHVGDFAIDEKFREEVTTYHCRDGIWQIEQLLSHREDKKFGVEHPNLAQLINVSKNGLGDGWTCTHATAEFSPIHLTNIVNHARQTALKFCLECEKEGIDLRWGEDDNTAPEDRVKWLKLIKEETTKIILKSTWENIWKALFS